MRINDFHNILALVKQDILQSEAEYLKLLKVTIPFKLDLVYDGV